MQPNDSAFPVPDTGRLGMSVRTWLAGQALGGLLARPDFNLFPHEGADMNTDLAADNAVRLADALLARLAQK